MRRDLLEIVSRLNALRPLGLQTIAMTSNGLTLAKQLSDLHAAGLSSSGGLGWRVGVGWMGAVWVVVTEGLGGDCAGRLPGSLCEQAAVVATVMQQHNQTPPHTLHLSHPQQA